MTGSVIQLFTTQDNDQKTRVMPDQISVDELGVQGDKFYAKDINRSILIASIDSYQLSKENGIELEYGALGENILIDINPYSLSSGDIITISGIKMKISQHCTLCQGLSNLNSKLPKLLKNDRGIFVQVIESRSSTIKLGDVVTI